MFDNFALQRYLWNRSDLTPSELAIAFGLTTYRNGSDGNCYPSQQHLAEKRGISRKHVNEIIRSLKRKGVLRVKKSRFPRSRKKTVTNYVFLFDEQRDV